MRWLRELPPADPDAAARLQAEGWQRLREPAGMGRTLAASSPFFLLLTALCAWEMAALSPGLWGLASGGGVRFTLRLADLSLAVAMVLGWTLLHEVLHALCLPGGLASPHTGMGLRGGFAFVHSSAALTRRRFLVVSVIPCVLLSFALPAVVPLFAPLPGWLAALCVLNAAGSCVDFLAAALVGWQVPRGGLVVSNGPETWGSALRPSRR